MSGDGNSVEKLRELLEDHAAKVRTEIEEKISEQSTSANDQVKALNEKLDALENGLKSLEETRKDKATFGLPGLEYEKSNWSWRKFWLASAIQAAHGRMPSIPAVDNPWEKVAPFEKEVIEQYGKRRKKDLMDNLQIFGDQKDYNSDDGSAGGYLVPPEIYTGDIIESVRAQTPLLSMPTMQFTGLRGDLPIPVDSSNLSAYWVGEKGKPTESTSSFDLKWLRPKKLGVFTKVSNRLLAFANANVEQIIKDKMARDASVELSNGFTNGTGTESKPLGLLAEVNRNAMTAGTAIGTNGGRFSIDHLMSMKQSLAAVNEMRDTNSYAALMHPNVLWGMLRERVTQYSGQAYQRGSLLTGSMIIDPSQLEAAARLSKIGSTTQIAANITKGTSSTCSYVCLGDMSKFATATFREPIFRVSDVAGDGSTGSAFLEDQLYMVMFMEVDSAMLRAAAFCLISDAETSEANW